MRTYSVCAIWLWALICVMAFGAAPAAAGRGGTMDASFENSYLKLVIGRDGRSVHFIDRKTGKDYCKPGAAFASVTKAGAVFPATQAVQDGDKLRLLFDGSGVEATVKITAKKDYFVMEVVSLTGDGVSAFNTIDIPLTLNGTMDEPFAGCALALDLKSNIQAWPELCSRLQATSVKRFGFVGAKVAIIGCPPNKMREILKEIVSAADEMPHSALGGPWAEDAPEVQGSYLFNFDGITEQNADAWISLAKSLGMTQIDFHGGGSFRFGDCRPNPGLYPNGFASLKAAIDKLHAAGIRAGLHTYAFMIAKDCPWVTPVPDPRLACDRVLTLTSPISETDATVTVDESTADMSMNTGFFVRNSVTIRIDEELITYTAIGKGSFTGCNRGAYGTKVAAHAKGAKVYHLLECFGLFAPDGDSTLFAELAQKTADAFNSCGFDNIYLDALDAEDVPGGPENGWHYGSKFTWELCKRLDKPALMEMSTFHHHLWCVRSRMGAWDHPNRSYKKFIDNHCAANDLNKRFFMPSELGWWAIKAWGGAQVEPTLPDVMEYLCCKCLANDTGYALMGISPESFAANPFAQRLAAISKRYEELRLSGKVPESIKAKLRQPGKGFTLENGPNGEARFRPVRYAKHKVEAIDGHSNVWKTTNDFAAQPLRLRIEALLSAGPYDAAGNVVLADFSDASQFAVRHAPPKVTAKLGSVSDPVKAGPVSGCFTATSSRADRKGAWAMVGREFSPALDLSAQQGMGVWVYGDGQGEILNIQVQSPAHITEAMAEHYIIVDFKGWRYFELIEPEGERFEDYLWPYNRPKLQWDKEAESADNAPQHWVSGHYGIYRESVSYGQIGSLSIWYNNLPAGKTITTYISPVKALPLVAGKLVNPAITIRGKTLTFPVEIESGSYLEFVSVSDCKLYDAAGNLVREVKPVGDVPVVGRGEQGIKFTATPSGDATSRAFVTVISQGEPVR